MNVSSGPYLFIAVMIAGQLLVTNVVPAARAQDDRSLRPAPAQRSDAWALDQIFGGQHLNDAALAVHRRAMSMDAESRFRFLSQWVLPGPAHPGFRLSVGFHPADPPSTELPSRTESFDSAGTDPKWNPVTLAGGIIVSPAIDLIAVAAELGRLASLRETIGAVQPRSTKDEIERTALLALLAIEEKDVAKAESLLGEVFTKLLAQPETLHRSRDTALLCLHRATDSLELTRMVFDAAQQVSQQYQSVYDRRAWEQHLLATAATLKRIIQRDEFGEKDPVAVTNQQWHPVVRSRAFEHGSGFPPPQWQMKPTSVWNLSSHGDDFLFFAVPLHGDYNVEADVSGFGWQDSHLMVAGTWVAPIVGHKSYGVGSIRGERPRGVIDPPISNADRFGPIHFRTLVKDSQATTFFNGRSVHTQTIGRVQDPWVAIRSSYRHNGGAEDVRISGNPTVPATISLSDSLNLPGWFEYYRIPLRDELGDWQQQIKSDPSTGETHGEIIGKRQPGLPTGSDAESLLVYARPLLEDGTIEYEFWYEPDQSITHPAFGRTCFLLNPNGVRIHDLTDGKYDQTSRRPGHTLEEPNNHRGPAELPLQAGAWNRMKLSLSGDRLGLELNGQPIYQRNVDAASQRTFGLFHYADREQARVRHVRWSGDWPKRLPELHDQKLAVIEPALREANSHHLTAKFSHSLKEDTFSSRRFSVTDGNPGNHFAVTADGLMTNRPAEEGYRNAKLSPNIELGGDFDITVRFDLMETQALPDMTATILLEVKADNEEIDLGSIQRKRDRKGDQMMQCLYMQTIGGTERRHYFNHHCVDAAAGQLRLSRRGDQLFYQFAENDSDQFRVMGRADFSSADLNANAIRFGAQIQGTAGYTRARWTEFHVRAERMKGMALENLDEKLANLNKERERLKSSFRFDFANQGPSPNDIFRWNEHEAWESNDQGLMIQSHGTKEWSGAGALLQREIHGDFDIVIEFDPEQLAIPAVGQESAIYLQAGMDSPDQAQVSSTLTRAPSGSLIAVAKLRTSTPSGEYQYQNLAAAEIPSVGRLRLTRRGGQIHYLVGSQAGSDDTIISSAEVGTAPINVSAVRVIVQTGGENRTSKVLLKSIDVAAEEIFGLEQRIRVQPLLQRAPNQSQPAKKPRSLFQSFLDIFQSPE